MPPRLLWDHLGGESRKWRHRRSDESTPRCMFAPEGSGTTTTFSSETLPVGSAGRHLYGFLAKIDPTTTGQASLDHLTFVGGHTPLPGTTTCQSLPGRVSLASAKGLQASSPYSAVCDNM